MPETKPIPVRLPEELIARLDACARKVPGNNRAGLIRYLIEAFVEEFEIKGKAMLPESWEQVLQSFDGRRRATTSYGTGVVEAGKKELQAGAAFVEGNDLEGKEFPKPASPTRRPGDDVSPMARMRSRKRKK